MATGTKAQVLYKTPEEYQKAFISTVRRLARSRKTPFTSEDITSKVGQPPHHPNAVGALMSFAAKEVGLTKVGQVVAQRANQHGARISAWIG